MGSQESSLVDHKMIPKKQTPIRATQKMQDPSSLQISGNNPILKNNTVIEEEKETSEQEFAYTNNTKTQWLSLGAKKKPPRAASLNRNAIKPSGIGVRSAVNVSPTPTKKVTPEMQWKRVAADLKKNDDWEK